MGREALGGEAVSLEAGVLVSRDGDPLYWHVPANRSAGGLPDSRALWDAIWDKRKELSGFAHSHPGGFSVPSTTDISTFRAVESGLGRRLNWWIVTERDIRLYRFHEAECGVPLCDLEKDAYAELFMDYRLVNRWLRRLRELSGYGDQ